jgi:hypothetical protein
MFHVERLWGGESIDLSGSHEEKAVQTGIERSGLFDLAEECVFVRNI